MKTVKGHLDGIIFDMDGTIIDTELVWETATADLLRQHNLHPETIPEDKHYVFEDMVGKGLYESIELLREAFDLAHVSSKDMSKHVIMVAKELFKEDIQFIHGFQEFHKKIEEAGIPVSIATNCDAESLESLVSKMDFNKYFGHNIYCVAHVENKAKPDPALFLHAADKIGANPEKCIVFEDSLHGFRAAQAANMKCIGIKNKKNNHFIAEHAHRHIDTYHDAEMALIEIIKEHFVK